MQRSSFAASPVRPVGALRTTARLERTLLGAAMSVMAFVLDRRVQGLSRARSLASS